MPLEPFLIRRIRRCARWARPVQFLDLNLAKHDPGIAPTYEANRSRHQFAMENLELNDLSTLNDHGDNVPVSDHLLYEPLTRLDRYDRVSLGQEPTHHRDSEVARVDLPLIRSTNHCNVLGRLSTPFCDSEPDSTVKSLCDFGFDSKMEIREVSEIRREGGCGGRSGGPREHPLEGLSKCAWGFRSMSSPQGPCR